jgi:sugar phosphate isomerase/epimerase
MEVAISSLLFKSLNLAEVADRAREMGITWLEVWTEHFWRDDDGRLFDRLRRSGLNLSVHGPIGDLNVTSTNDGILAESLKQTFSGGRDDQTQTGREPSFFGRLPTERWKQL